MARIDTNDEDLSTSFDNFAVFTNSFYTSANFHLITVLSEYEFFTLLERKILLKPVKDNIVSN